MSRSWEDSLCGFARATEALVAGRELLRRAESKFVMPVAAAAALVPALRHDYVVLPADASLVASYRSLYFDTTDLAFFHAQRRGRRIRHKVRIRHYPDRLVSFLEVKQRLGTGMTLKARRQRLYGDNVISADDCRFLGAHCSSPSALVSQAWIEYRRITLLNTRTDERVTVDFELSLSSGACRTCLPDAAIVEVKQSRLDHRSVVMMALRRAGRRPSWASKYCAAVAFAHPELRANRLLAGLRALKTVGPWTH